MRKASKLAHPVSAAACALAWLAAPLHIAGCESFGGANPEVPLWVHRPNGALGVVLYQPITIPERKYGEEYERGRPAIDPVHKRVFVGSSDHGLYAVRADDGRLLWRFETLGPVQSAPLYVPSENTVYFGSNDGALYKVRASDGELLWRFATNGEVARTPVIRNGLLYVVNANDTVVALDPKTGRMKWTAHRAPALGMEIAGYAGPLVTDERVYVAYSDGHVAAYDALDGTERWTPPVDLAAEVEQTGGEVPRFLDVDTTPVFATIPAGQVVFVGSYAGGVYALDAQTGARVWANERVTGPVELVLFQEPAHPPRDGVGPLVPARSMLLASSGTTGLWALSPEDGHELWRRDLPAGGASAPVPIAGALLVSTTEYGVFLLSPLSGAAIDGLSMSGGLAATPAVYGHRAFVLTNGGSLLGLEVTPPGERPPSHTSL